VFTQKRRFLCVWVGLVAVVSLFVMAAGAQIASRANASPLRSSASRSSGSGGTLDLQAVSRGPQGPIATAGFSNDVASDPPASSAIPEAATHDKAVMKEAAPDGSQIEVSKAVGDPHSADHKLPATLTVSTAALLELHAMRQSAVDLCLELPAKYRTQLPQCAEIFKHEIRLKALAKNRK
jgi:hypothetical protein